MERIWSKLLLCGAFTVAASALAADDAKSDKKDTKPAAAKPADFSAYATADTVTAVVVTADEDSVTIRVSWLAQKGANSMRRGRNSRPNLKEEHTDYVLKYADGGLARWKKLPPKLDGDGKKAGYSMKEMEELRKPTGAVGFAAEKSDLKAGTVAELHLLRPKEIKADKATAEDLVIKYAVIVGETDKIPTPDKKDAAAKKVEKKVEKKDEKK